MSSRKSSPPKPRRTDPPLKLDSERDAFIQTFFKKGVQLSQELLQENERLRKDLTALEKDNAELRLHLRSDQAVRELLHKIEHLEQEKDRLLSQVREVEARSSEFAMTYDEVESELSNLASLYVASSQLHSTMSLRGVLRHIEELLQQLVGAKSFALFFVSDDAKQLLPIVTGGVSSEQVGRLPVGGDDPIGKAFSTGIASIHEGRLSSRTVEDPAACVPLRIDDRVVGVIALFTTLEQKTRFLPVDYEFFKLLAAHAAAAIVAAVLFAQTTGKIPGAESLLEMGV